MDRVLKTDMPEESQIQALCNLGEWDRWVSKCGAQVLASLNGTRTSAIRTIESYNKNKTHTTRRLSSKHAKDDAFVSLQDEVTILKARIEELQVMESKVANQCLSEARIEELQVTESNVANQCTKAELADTEFKCEPL